MIKIITIGTDSFVDWVQTPDGRKYTLGPVSVLNLILGLVPLHEAKKVLKEFLSNKQVLISADLDKMWDLLPFHRARYSTDNNSFVNSSSCNLIPPKGGSKEANKMAIDIVTKGAIERQIAVIEKELSNLQASGMPKGMLSSQVEALKGMIAKMQETPPYGDQSKNKDFYTKTASYEIFKANTGMVERIKDRLSATNSRIEDLVAQGKKFNSKRAKEDLGKIACQLAEMTQNVDLAHSWVSEDLEQLAEQADQMGDLFEPKQQQ